MPDVIARNSGYSAMIANIVVGIGFLGAGLIIKTNDQPHGVTTAALIWTAAAIGILVGDRAHAVRIRGGGAARDIALSAPQVECERKLGEGARGEEIDLKDIIRIQSGAQKKRAVIITALRAE